MGANTALKRYLERHIEPELPEIPRQERPWRNVLVIPAYAESSSLLDALSTSLCGPGRVLVILVINRPDSDDDSQCNEELREAIHRRDKALANTGGTTSGTTSGSASSRTRGNATGLLPLNMHSDLFVYDMEALRGPSPSKEGVGLARKVGCDIALLCWHRGQIESDWICSSDADATLPNDYFARLIATQESTAAATFPFQHMPGRDDQLNYATLVYELRLHHYVLGLEYAGSGYAYHTLGSALAVKCDHYVQVRGFPKRSGGEDFYLLNKLAKTGSIERVTGLCIGLESRVSARVPFGTGPAVEKLLEHGKPDEQPLFYHPQCFYALRAVLATITTLEASQADDLPRALQGHSLDKHLAQASYESLLKLGLENILEHCIRQSTSQAQFARQFHQWFDGFRTLKFIHALRERGWEDQTLKNLSRIAPTLWPGQAAQTANQTLEAEVLRRAIQHHWDWTIEAQ